MSCNVFVCLWCAAAVQVYDYKAKKARIMFGPDLVRTYSYGLYGTLWTISYGYGTYSSYGTHLITLHH